MQSAFCQIRLLEDSEFLVVLSGLEIQLPRRWTSSWAWAQQFCCFSSWNYVLRSLELEESMRSIEMT